MPKFNNHLSGDQDSQHIKSLSDDHKNSDINMSADTEVKIQTEAQVDNVKESAKQQEKFDKLVDQGTRILYKLKTVFPFDLFPNTMTIDPGKITVSFREFFSSGEIRSVPVSSIIHVYAETSIFFGTITIVDQALGQASAKMKISYFKKDEALKARRIIQGLIVAQRQGIDIGRIEDEEMVNKLEDLGKMQ